MPDRQMDWEVRFKTSRISLPVWSTLNPERCAFLGNESGTFQVYAGTRSSFQTRQITQHERGVRAAALDPMGRWIWWFDEEVAECGTWKKQSYGSEWVTLAASTLPASITTGLTFFPDGTAIIGCVDEEFEVHKVDTFGNTHLLCKSDTPMVPLDATENFEELVAILIEPLTGLISTLRLVNAVGETCAELDLQADQDESLSPCGFAPNSQDSRYLLVGNGGDDGPSLHTWDWHLNKVTRYPIEISGIVEAIWDPTDSTVIVLSHADGRSHLYRYCFDSARCELIATPSGLITQASVRPSGGIDFIWSSSSQPPRILTLGDDPIQFLPPLPPGSTTAEQHWVEGNGGLIHVFLSRPTPETNLVGTVMLLHGGPAGHDADAFSPLVAAWIDSGFVVVQPNYRGSSGYGSSWERANWGRPGLTEVEDLLSVQKWLLDKGFTEEGRLILAGESWGGYLTLLALGVASEYWACGIALRPIADFVTAWNEEPVWLQAEDMRLFGGSPEDVPERYLESSPLTYVKQIQSPLLVGGSVEDPRCTWNQLTQFITSAHLAGVDLRVEKLRDGHGSLESSERIRETRLQINFARSILTASVL